MRVVHITFSDSIGGASHSIRCLNKELLRAGIDGKLVVMRQESDDPTVIKAKNSLFGRVLSSISPSVDAFPLRFYRRNSKIIWSPGLFDLFGLERLPVILNTDIISLYWVCYGFLSPKTIGKLLRTGKPVIWRLSDMWPFTGGCHYSGSCTRYEDKCGCCPQLGSSRDRDLSRFVWNRKKRWWQGNPLTIVCPSKWIARCAQHSSLFRDARIEIIPTGVNINLFKPIPKEVARSILSLPLDKKLILFGAISALDDNRKGSQYLINALDIINQHNHEKLPELLIFGTMKRPNRPNWKFDVHVMGHIRDEITMALLYSAADVFVAPYVEENLSNAVLEALSCGTPTVAFNIGGMPDVIDHLQNGYLASPLNVEELSNGINWVLSEQKRWVNLSIGARKRIEQGFTSEMQAKKYIQLYKEVLSIP